MDETDDDAAEAAAAGSARAVYIFEPDEEEILEDLLPRNMRNTDIPGAARKLGFRARCPDDRDGQRDTERR